MDLDSAAPTSPYKTLYVEICRDNRKSGRKGVRLTYCVHQAEELGSSGKKGYDFLRIASDE